MEGGHLKITISLGVILDAKKIVCNRKSWVSEMSNHCRLKVTLITAVEDR